MMPLRILTWHVHGSYLYYLVQSGHHFYLPVKAGRPHGFGGRVGPFPWPDTVHEVAVEAVRDLELDCILFQARQNWEQDQYEMFSEEQRRLPRIYLEHDPPRQHPTDTRHWMQDPAVLLVHCTPFNHLMWDSGNVPSRIIDHGVMVPEEVRYTGELARGLVVINNLAARGRRLGADLFERLREEIPLDLVGMGTETMGGLGEVLHPDLPGFMARYRFLLNPIRYTSLGLSVCEAMMIGLPIVGLATTEMTTVIQNGVSGYLDTDPRILVFRMRQLLRDAELAGRLGEEARRYAERRFHIRRFLRQWDEAFEFVTSRRAVGELESVV